MQNKILHYAPPRPRLHSRIAGLAWRCRQPAFCIASSMLMYVAAYVCLSIGGRYEPAVIGTNGVKWYTWAPHGFVHGFRWNHSLAIFFQPLHQLDRRLWHVDGGDWSGKYPVHRPADVADVVRDWK